MKGILVGAGSFPRGRGRIWTGASVVLALFLFGEIYACRPAEKAGARPIFGVKIYEPPKNTVALFREWASLGINTALVSQTLLADDGFRSSARKNGVALFVIFPVFQSPEELANQPNLAAITAGGEPAREDWVQFVCPTRNEFRMRRIEQVKKLVSVYHPDGLSLDFIRFFVFWEMAQPNRMPDSLPQTCFCQSCLSDFQKTQNVRIPENLSGTAETARWILANKLPEWTAWKCGVIASTVKDLVGAARSIEPGLKINVHTVPWRKEDFGGAIETIAGQDLARIGGLVDYLSPMCYHHMVGRLPDWIHDVVRDVFDRGRIGVLPSIQVDKAYVEKDLSAEEFEAALAEALKPPSRGVLLWNWIALERSPEKQRIVRAYFRPATSPN